MKELVIEGTEFTPAINFNPLTGVFSISGEARPTDAGEFFKSAIEWLEQFKTYCEFSPKVTEETQITLQVKLHYFNSASAKYLFDIFHSFEEIYEKDIPVNIHWFYKEEDEDHKEFGLEFKRILLLPFEVIIESEDLIEEFA